MDDHTVTIPPQQPNLDPHDIVAEVNAVERYCRAALRWSKVPWEMEESQ